MREQPRTARWEAGGADLGSLEAGSADAGKMSASLLSESGEGGGRVDAKSSLYKDCGTKSRGDTGRNHSLKSAWGLREGVVEPGRTDLGGGTKELVGAISLSHPPAEIPKGTSSRHRTCTAQSPNAVLLGIHPSAGSVLPVLQGPSRPCADPPPGIRSVGSWPDPIEAAPQAWQCASSPDGPHHSTRRGSALQFGATTSLANSGSDPVRPRPTH
ncbi:uncharacterized protein LOC124509884 [Lynx rufus]|uniref:uncharacterized protein LOC124509884 n=1 Tax=Lynx rufus TaxID=61384 RepID=UPI001F1247D7|nr:uncharacterized protein LOC124509884 [Lynx rufus]